MIEGAGTVEKLGTYRKTVQRKRFHKSVERRKQSTKKAGRIRSQLEKREVDSKNKRKRERIGSIKP